MSKTIACEWCGKSFIQRKRDQRFCGKEHQRAAVNKRYHMQKKVDARRPRMSEASIAEQIGELASRRLEWLDAQARCVEAEQQILACKGRLLARKAALAKHDQAAGMKLIARKIEEGEPVGEPPEGTQAVGIVTTDGLLGVVVFARPV